MGHLVWVGGWLWHSGSVCVRERESVCRCASDCVSVEAEVVASW